MKLSRAEKIVICIAAVMVAMGFFLGRMTAPVVTTPPIDFEAPYKHREDSIKAIIQVRNNRINILEQKLVADSINTQKKYHEIFNFTPLARNRWRDSVRTANHLGRR